MKSQNRGCLHIVAYPVVLWIGLMVIGCVQPVNPLPGPGPDGGNDGQPVQPVDPVAPTPDPVTIEAAAELGIRLYAEKSAAAFESLAADIEAGKFTSQAAMADEMDVRTKVARVAAFEAMRSAWQEDQAKESGSGAWTSSEDVRRCRETAAGFRRAVAK